MGHTPIEGSEILSYTPESLLNLPRPPVFDLKAGTTRDRSRYRAALVQEGLRFHGVEEFRSETLKALETLWDGDKHKDDYLSRIRAYWDYQDQHEKEEKLAEKSLPQEFPEGERNEIEALFERAVEAWPRLRKLASDNLRFQDSSADVILAHILVDWRNIDVPFAREAGIIGLGKIEEIESELSRIEDGARQANIEGVGEGLAYLQLCAKAAGRIVFSPETARNLSSPAPSSVIQPPTKEPGRGSRGGRSMAQGNSKKTRALSSAKKK